PEAKDRGYIDIAIDIMNSLANLYYIQGQYGEALSLLSDSAAMARDFQLISQEVKILNNTAQIFMQLGDHQGALDHLIQLQSKLIGLPEDKRNESSYLLSISKLYQQLGDNNSSLSCLNEALEYAKKQKDSKILAAVQNNLADLHLRCGEYDLAEKMFLSSLKLAELSGHVPYLIDNLDGLGELLYHRKDFCGAIKKHQKALQLSQQSGHGEGIIDALIHIGKNQLALEQLETAQDSLQSALALAQAASRKTTLAETHKLLSDSYKKLFEFDKALEHFEAYQSVCEQIHLDENGHKNTIFQARLTLERTRMTRKINQQVLAETQHQIATRTKELELFQRELVTVMANAIEYPTDPTGEHSYRVSEYAARIAIALDWSAEDSEQLRLATQLHDLGKIGISSAIRENKGKLTPEEYKIVQAHPKIAEHLLQGVESKLLKLISKIAISHHERWDGLGYPNGLRGEDIFIGARIVAVAETYDLLTRGSSYQESLDYHAALEEIEKQSGKQFDPSIVKAALAVFR
ncbi:MAG: hypothetical protein RLZZ156_2043, partial [Deinococcota bacterium]